MSGMSRSDRGHNLQKPDVPNTEVVPSAKWQEMFLLQNAENPRDNSLVLTVVDEMCFFSISAQRQTSGLTACAEYPFARVCHAAKFRRKGRRSPSSDTARQAAASTERP